MKDRRIKVMEKAILEKIWSIFSSIILIPKQKNGSVNNNFIGFFLS